MNYYTNRPDSIKVLVWEFIQFIITYSTIFATELGNKKAQEKKKEINA